MRVCFGSAEQYLYRLKLHYHIIDRCDSDPVTATRNRKQKQNKCFWLARVRYEHSICSSNVNDKIVPAGNPNVNHDGYRYRFSYAIGNLSYHRRISAQRYQRYRAKFSFRMSISFDQSFLVSDVAPKYSKPFRKLVPSISAGLSHYL